MEQESHFVSAHNFSDGSILSRQCVSSMRLCVTIKTDNSYLLLTALTTISCGRVPWSLCGNFLYFVSSFWSCLVWDGYIPISLYQIWIIFIARLYNSWILTYLHATIQIFSPQLEKMSWNKEIIAFLHQVLHFLHEVRSNINGRRQW